MMRKLTLFLALVIVSLFTVTGTKVYASSATTYTYAFDKKGFFAITQDAYLPDRTILDLQLDGPEDIFVDEDDNLFIADTGNRRIVVYNPATDTVLYEITHDEFSTPRGIFLTEDNELYVADSGASKIFRFTKAGDFITDYGKPDSVNFEDTQFNPKKIAVDKQDNMFVVAEGVYDGIIQLSSNGNFLGFFARNKVYLTPRQRLENLLFTETQLETVADRNPTSFSNIYVDLDGRVYSTSFGANVMSLKKHNTDGSTAFKDFYTGDLELLDVYTDQDGIIYTASEDGFIYIFTSDGNYIFGFGSIADEADVAGLFTSLAAIAVDSTGRIWTVDANKAFLQSFTPTDYTNSIYYALSLYKEGRYQEAVTEWEEVLRLNQLSVLAHNEIGRNLYSQGEYERSMTHFELSGNRFLYSEAYWEVRNVALQENLPFILIGLVVFAVGFYTVKFTNRKYHYLATPAGYVKKVGEVKVINDVLYMFNLVKHPLDSFYYLKKKQKGSYLGATIIYFLFFFSFMIFTTSKGFIYQFVEAADMDLNAIVLGFFALTILFVICNYLVTSINDGEGSLGEIYKGVMYSLMPVIVAYLVVTYLSYYLTFNEVFLLQFTVLAGMGWSALLVFLSIQEIHNYTIRNTIKSILLTFVFMLIIGVLFAFIQIMGDQLIQFIIALVKEVIRNVFA